MSEPAPSPSGGAGRVARLWGDDDPSGPVGHLVTRWCTHWDTVGPHAFPRHVNPRPRVEWRAHFEPGPDPALADDLYSDDPDAPALPSQDGTGPLVVRGRPLRVEWLDGAEAAAVRDRLAW